MTILHYRSWVFGLATASLMPLSHASNGVYLVTDGPDDPANNIKHLTDFDDLHKNDAGYLKIGPDRHVLGWRLDSAAYPAPTPSMPGGELGLVQTTPSQMPHMPTHSVTTVFSLSTVAGSEHDFSWPIYDDRGHVHHVVGQFKKQDSLSWNLNFMSPGVDLIVHEVPGVGVYDWMSSQGVDFHYTMRFNEQGTLSEMGTPHGTMTGASPVLRFQWDNHAMQNVTFNFGEVGLPAGDLWAIEQKDLEPGQALMVKYSSQDGQGERKIVGYEIDHNAIFHTRYDNMSSQPSYQIAHVRCLATGGYEPLPYTSEELDIIQEMTQYDD